MKPHEKTTSVPRFQKKDTNETEPYYSNPELAIYAAVMEKILSDPHMEAAFFGIKEKKRHFAKK